MKNKKESKTQKQISDCDLKELGEMVKREREELMGLAATMTLYEGKEFQPSVKGEINELHDRMEFRLKAHMFLYELEGFAIRKEIYKQVINLMKQ